MAWTEHPVVLEVNTWVWLAELSAAGRHVTLATVPREAWDELCRPGVDALWLMGVWERSPVGAAIGRVEPGFRQAHLALLPGYTDADVVGSPYSVRRYEVDPHLGGTPALAVARAELDRRGVALVLDLVPNHVAPDHPWALERPELLVHGTEEELAADPRSFRRVGAHVLACGRDPYFPAWTDVVQLNAFAQPLRDATAATLARIATMADGVRCDMAMLLLNDVFARTWGDRVGPPPAAEFWPPIIAEVRRSAPSFLFVAEAYWDLEPRLLDQGFDHCYDKRLYDRLVTADVPGVRERLRAPPDQQRRTLRFLENHDEPRSASLLPGDARRAAAVALCTLPGALLLYEGQAEGRTVRPPVQLGRRPVEPADLALREFYERLLGAVQSEGLRDGTWTLLDVEPAEAARGLLAWSWEAAGRRFVVAVNLSDLRVQGWVRLPWSHRGADRLVVAELLSEARYDHAAAEVAEAGLYVLLDAHAWHLFRIEDST